MTQHDDKTPNSAEAAPVDADHVRLDQSTETPLTSRIMPFGTALYLYNRSNDSVDAATVGQDYLTFRYDAENLAFAVCDGVGQSFMGDLAARILGDGLIDWLLGLDKRPTDANTFGEMVTQALNDMTETSAEQVASFELPAHLPPILKQALEMQRKYGSESMFVAGRIALGTAPWVALCWLGDSPVAAIDLNGELVDLGPHGSTAERWNATSGLKGEVHTWVSSAENVARVAGYTDGLGVEVEDVPTDADLARLMDIWPENPPGDDATLFDVRLAPSPATTGQAQPPEPEDVPTPRFKPIQVTDEDVRTPIARLETIDQPPESTAVSGWRSLHDEPADAEAPADKSRVEPVPGALTAAGHRLPTPSKLAQQQMAVWQQAALLGLTSAALAMMMTQRLLEQEGFLASFQPDDEDGDDSETDSE